MQNPSIDISNLQKQYRGSDSYALQDIDLRIGTGEIFGVLGPNGAGKTTLFSILSGILKATKGDVKIHGLEIESNLEEIKKLFGIVPQDIALYPTLTGMENLLYIGRMYGLSKSDLASRIEYYLDLFDVIKFKSVPVKTYSGGTQRKFNLIGGLLHQPKILMLDEPTVGVDVQTRMAIMRHLKEINNHDNVTILYTSHYLEQAQEFCDRIGILSSGRLLTVDTPGNLMSTSDQPDLESVFLQLTDRNPRRFDV